MDNYCLNFSKRTHTIKVVVDAALGKNPISSYLIAEVAVPKVSVHQVNLFTMTNCVKIRKFLSTVTLQKYTLKTTLDWFTAGDCHHITFTQHIQYRNQE